MTPARLLAIWEECRPATATHYEDSTIHLRTSSVPRLDLWFEELLERLRIVRDTTNTPPKSGTEVTFSLTYKRPKVKKMALRLSEVI